MTKASDRGLFLVLDGLDGCGKSTQAGLLVRALERERGRAPLHLREPGSTRAGERIRALLLDPQTPLGPAPQALLFAAARRQMLDECVRPALESGRDVVCERFHPSTFAYQGVALGLGEEAVLALLADWAGDPRPDLTVILELDPAEAAARRAGGDRFESREREFHGKVAQGYRRYAERSERVAVVNARGAIDEVHARVMEELHRAGR